MADNNSKKPMALLLLVVVAVLVVILMTPPVNCTTITCGDEVSQLSKQACEEEGKVYKEVKNHAREVVDCKGTYWDLNVEAGCLAAGKSWTAGDPGDANATPPVPAKEAECK